MYVTAYRMDPMRVKAYIVCRVYDRQHSIRGRQARHGNAAFLWPNADLWALWSGPMALMHM